MNIRNILKFLFKTKKTAKDNNHSIDSFNHKITFEQNIPFSDTLFLSHFNYIYIQDESLDYLKVKIDCNSLNKDSIMIDGNSIYRKDQAFWTQDIIITIYGKIPANLILDHFAKVKIDTIQSNNKQNIELLNDSKIDINTINIELLDINLSQRSSININKVFSKNLNFCLNNSFATLFESFNSNIILKGNKFNFSYHSLNNSNVSIGEKNDN